jgi:hypothetical protein
MYHTVSEANVEYFEIVREAETFADLSNLFLLESNVMPLGDEFAPVIADGAAGRLCMNAGSMVEQGAAFLQAYYSGLKERNVNVQPADFPAQPAA